MTETGVGASTWASGNQVWNGNIGILMANPMKRPTKATFANSSPRIGGALRKTPAWPCRASSTRLKVWPADIVPSASSAGCEL